MSGGAPVSLEMHAGGPRHRFGLKGPRAAAWLEGHGIPVPAAPNTWVLQPVAGRDSGPLVARLGTGEFFLEDGPGAGFLRGIEPDPHTHPPGVYPVVRRDAAFVLSGLRVHEALAQVCNVNFADAPVHARAVFMTSMIGVSVLVVPGEEDGVRRYRIWCDPTFGAYLKESLEAVIIECGGNYRGVAE